MKKSFTAICFIAFIFLTKTNIAQVNKNDSLALVDLYNGTDGPHWRQNTNWLTTKPVSTWYGIQQTNNRVSSVLLSSNFLSGNIPSSFENLTGLTSLILSVNKLSGSIPSSLGNFVNLTNLQLQGNQFSGSIPSSIGNLIQLTFLSFNGNQLKGSIPASLGNLNKLTYLDLSVNDLTGSIPSSIGNLTNLTNLSLSNNDLTGTIPSSIGNLIKLGTLLLNKNGLSGGIPSFLGNLTSLYSLYLNNNAFSGSIPSSLGNLTYMRNLYLNNNALNNGIPAELSNCTNLQHLDLSHNLLTDTIPSQLGNLKYVVSIDVSHNQLTGSIPHKLNHLYCNFDFSHNQLSGKPISFSNSSKYYTISVAYNNFTFAGMLNLARRNFAGFEYAPQANIPIHKNANILSVYTGGEYQLLHDTFKWYKNGSLVATVKHDSTFTPTKNGKYNVVVTNSIVTDLTLYSDTINYTVSDNLMAEKMNNNSSILLYPNPAKSNATLSFYADGKYSITITDVSGRTLQTKAGVANKSVNIIELDVSKYANGMYLITIVDEKNRKQTLKLTKE